MFITSPAFVIQTLYTKLANMSKTQDPISLYTIEDFENLTTSVN